VFAEWKKAIAMSAMDIVMAPLIEWSLMLVVMSIWVVDVGVGVALAIAVVGEVIFMPDISMV
jgi:hypothetical protein